MILKGVEMNVVEAEVEVVLMDNALTAMGQDS